MGTLNQTKIISDCAIAWFISCLFAGGLGQLTKNPYSFYLNNITLWSRLDREYVTGSKLLGSVYFCHWVSYSNELLRLWRIPHFSKRKNLGSIIVSCERKIVLFHPKWSKQKSTPPNPKIKEYGIMTERRKLYYRGRLWRLKPPHFRSPDEWIGFKSWRIRAGLQNTLSLAVSRFQERMCYAGVLRPSPQPVCRYLAQKTKIKATILTQLFPTVMDFCIFQFFDIWLYSAWVSLGARGYARESALVL